MAKARYRCEMCKKNWGVVTGEIMPAVWGSFCRRCVKAVASRCARLLREARRGK